MRDYVTELDTEIVVGYGITETTPVTHIAERIPSMADLDREDRLDVRSRAGLIQPGLEMKVVDDEGEEVP